MIEQREIFHQSLGDVKTVSLTWKDLKYTVQVREKRKKKQAKEIIHGVEGAVLPGQMLAILGGSGAGKSTLLDILANRKSTGEIGGTVAINGTPVENTGNFYQRYSGYVTQEDVFLPRATVQENLQFFADLTMESTFSRAERKARVVQVMEELSISHLASERIGGLEEKGLSGGEKKRVAIAEQLLRDPLLLFLDEPTSGLDAFNSQKVMELLNTLAVKRGMTVVASIHQPRSTIFELFDKLLILQKGETAYFGDASKSIEYFASLGHVLPQAFNPPDFFIDVVLGKENSGKNFPKLFSDSDYSKSVSMTVENSLNSVAKLDHIEAPAYARGYWTQFRYLYSRLFFDALRNPQAAAINLVQAVVLGLIVGSVFYQLGNTPGDQFARSGLLFFSLLSGAFPITATAVLMVQSRPIINRERASGVYGVVPYWLARSFIDIPIHILLPVIFNSIIYFMAGLRPSAGAFFIHLGVTILNCMVAGSLYTVLGAVSTDALVANVMSFVITVILMLFCGFLATVPVWWIWLEYISFLRYGFIGLMVNQFADGTPEGQATLALFGLEDGNIWSSVVALVCQLIIYRALALVCIAFVNNEKR